MNYQEICDNKENGNISTARQQFIEMSPKEQYNMLAWLLNQDAPYDGETCNKLCMFFIRAMQRHLE